MFFRGDDMNGGFLFFLLGVVGGASGNWCGKKDACILAMLAVIIYYRVVKGGGSKGRGFPNLP